MKQAFFVIIGLAAASWPFTIGASVFDVTPSTYCSSNNINTWAKGEQNEYIQLGCVCRLLHISCIFIFFQSTIFAVCHQSPAIVEVPSRDTSTMQQALCVKSSFMVDAEEILTTLESHTGATRLAVSPCCTHLYTPFQACMYVMYL